MQRNNLGVIKKIMKAILGIAIRLVIPVLMCAINCVEARSNYADTIQQLQVKKLEVLEYLDRVYKATYQFDFESMMVKVESVEMGAYAYCSDSIAFEVNLSLAEFISFVRDSMTSDYLEIRSPEAGLNYKFDFVFDNLDKKTISTVFSEHSIKESYDTKVLSMKRYIAPFFCKPVRPVEYIRHRFIRDLVETKALERTGAASGFARIDKSDPLLYSQLTQLCELSPESESQDHEFKIWEYTGSLGKLSRLDSSSKAWLLRCDNASCRFSTCVVVESHGRKSIVYRSKEHANTVRFYKDRMSVMLPSPVPGMQTVSVFTLIEPSDSTTVAFQFYLELDVPTGLQLSEERIVSGVTYLVNQDVELSHKPNGPTLESGIVVKEGMLADIIQGAIRDRGSGFEWVLCAFYDKDEFAKEGHRYKFVGWVQLSCLQQIDYTYFLEN